MRYREILPVPLIGERVLKVDGLKRDGVLRMEIVFVVRMRRRGRVVGVATVFAGRGA